MPRHISTSESILTTYGNAKMNSQLQRIMPLFISSSQTINDLTWVLPACINPMRLYRLNHKPYKFILSGQEQTVKSSVKCGPKRPTKDCIIALSLLALHMIYQKYFIFMKNVFLLHCCFFVMLSGPT